MPIPAATVNPTSPQIGADADQHRAGRAGETDMGQRVAGESLAAQHQEITDQPRHDGGDASGREGVPHEIVFKHGVMTVPCHGRHVVTIV